MFSSGCYQGDAPGGCQRGRVFQGPRITGRFGSRVPGAFMSSSLSLFRATSFLNLEKRSTLRTLKNMPSFFFPCLSIVPDFKERLLECEGITVRHRLFPTSTFDLATLETRHTLHLPYQLMDVYLPSCKLEIEIKDSSSYEEAAEKLQVTRLLFYVQGLSPFLVPFCTTYSINDYSGINSRDSDLLRHKLPAEMQGGIRSETHCLEAWPLDSQLTVLRTQTQSHKLSPLMCMKAAEIVPAWENLAEKHPTLNLVRKMMNVAPLITDVGSAILHVWQAIEALFPNVSSEVSFRVAVLVTQLCSVVERPALMYEATREGYRVRSRIAHGSRTNISSEDWRRAWNILRSCISAIIEREELPSEEQLFNELF
jgi:hypothetical protein